MSADCWCVLSNFPVSFHNYPVFNTVADCGLWVNGEYQVAAAFQMQGWGVALKLGWPTAKCSIEQDRDSSGTSTL